MKRLQSMLMAQKDKKIVQAKLVLIGDTGAGKTSLVLRFAVNQFYNHEQTVGASVVSRKLSVKEATIDLNIWDTAGQERFRSVVPIYYRGAAVAFVVYDITSMTSFDRAKNWADELREHGKPNMIIFFVGNKADLDDYREVSSEEAYKFAKENRMTFLETSAKTGQNIQELFHETAQRLANAEIVDEGKMLRQANKIILDVSQKWERREFCCLG